MYSPKYFNLITNLHHLQMSSNTSRVRLIPVTYEQQDMTFSNPLVSAGMLHQAKWSTTTNWKEMSCEQLWTRGKIRTNCFTFCPLNELHNSCPLIVFAMFMQVLAWIFYIFQSNIFSLHGREISIYFYQWKIHIYHACSWSIYLFTKKKTKLYG